MIMDIFRDNEALIGPTLGQFIDVGDDLDRMKARLLEHNADDIATILDSCNDAIIRDDDDADEQVQKSIGDYLECFCQLIFLIFKAIYQLI